MDIQSLQYILKLDECRNFSEAASQCDISQSSFSKHIRRVEEEYGVELFDRSARPLKVTAAGRELIPYARQILDAYRALNRTMRKYRQAYQQELNVGSIPVMGALGISNLVQNFQRTLKNGEKVIIRDLPNKELISALKSGALDLAFLPYPVSQQSSDDLISYQLKEYELLLIVGLSDPMAKADSACADWSDLRSRHFISQEEGSHMYSIYQAAFHAHNLNWENVTPLRSVSSIVESVEAGYGVAMLSKPVIAYYQEHAIKAIPMNDPLTYTLFLACSGRSRLKPLAQRFLNMALEWKFA